MFTNATSFKASDTDIGRTEEEDVIMLSRQGGDTMPTSKNSTSEREREDETKSAWDRIRVLLWDINLKRGHARHIHQPLNDCDCE